MAGWSAIADGSARDCAKTPERRLLLNGVLVDLEPPSSGSVSEVHVDKAKLRKLFDRILPSFLKRIGAPHAFWPLPPLLGDGHTVDLFRLFVVVIKKGGYDAVSENGLWGLVAKESGLCLSVASAVKLVYIKYLDPLQRLLDVFVENNISKGKLSNTASNLDGFLMDLGGEFREFLSEITGSKKKDEGSLNSGTEVDLDGCGKSSHDEEYIHIDSRNSIKEFLEATKLGSDDEVKSTVVDSDGDKKRLIVGETPFSDSSKSGFNLSDFSKVPNETKSVVNESDGSDDDVVILDSDGDKKCLIVGETPFSDSSKSGFNLSNFSKVSNETKSVVNDSHGSDDDVVILDPDDTKEKIFGRKRKRISLWPMLQWLIRVAKDPCAPVVGSLPECSGWESYGKEELWKQVLSAREALFLKMTLDSTIVSTNCVRTLQKNQKMHPSLYDDHSGSNYNLRDRLSCRRDLPSGKALSNTQPYSQSSSPDFDTGRSCGSARMENHGEKETNRRKKSVFDYTEIDQVLLGSNFQVEVPEWTGVASESDPKWLGTRIWPLKEKRMILIERDRIGKGRLGSCGCQVQDSIERVRFHVAEKRLRVKLELGSAFYDWNIDKMGETVALSWTKEEEKNFKAIVGSDPPSHCFRDQVFESFRRKNRQFVVSYYFNAVLLQRRAHQNRFTPNYINSDEDEAESESESISDPIKNGTIKKPSSLLCSPGKAHKKSRH
ncbi:AT-rich interactive domain-containing protein 1-like [Tripterygium wilfordii]|uniref:AT-rich interactive domain-containing protein 1-like n=1 Tax=Tripterygium wilfordii TaxID=458696 RepID=UPI0018F82085|nr:AT-rich interactive domain-containing protein 1-like [Tripterygium wilfordii]